MLSENHRNRIGLNSRFGNDFFHDHNIVVTLGLLVLKAGVTRSRDDIVTEVVQQVRDRIGPVAVFKKAAVVDRLPKTRSGKILRGTMRRMADSETYKVPATIEEPATLDEIRDALVQLGYART